MAIFIETLYSEAYYSLASNLQLHSQLFNRIIYFINTAYYKSFKQYIKQHG